MTTASAEKTTGGSMAFDADAFRTEVRDWLERTGARYEDVPDADIARSKEFAAELHRAHLAGLSWPESFGGRGLGTAQARIFQEESSRYRLPTGVFGMGLNMVGPTILDLGTERQKARFIPPILEGRELWCQLFSEPEAGSDVASLRTRAVRDGDHWVVTGQKVWTTYAHLSDWGLLLARTDPDAPKHAGITMFIVPMDAPGLEIRPLRDMTGTANFNEVFLDEVRIPADEILGELHAGWTSVRTLLAHERIGMAAGIGPIPRASSPLAVANLIAAARAAGLLEQPGARADLVDLHLLESTVEAMTDRIVRIAADGDDIGERGSMGKLTRGRLEARSAALAARLTAGGLLGDDGALDLMRKSALYAPAFSLGGGTNEIQLSVIGERALGLPREPRPAEARS
jgi:alkylation response protein AidB-like acyl-CoA dehydrogenase